ncbi:MAG: MarR family transcriptional regulator, partial [Streptomycetaceae bacterium]|nr:MarR family transcriptional regulator [Streptomycetaceae bacterium]
HRHGPLGVKEIAERLGVEQSTASRQIRPLEEHGLVHRDTDPRDGRAVRLHLTDAGLDVRERVRQVWLRDIATVWRDWDPAERAQLATLLTRFRDSFRELRGGD